jgi:hypothetical protein
MFTQYYGNQIKKNEMSEACRIHDERRSAHKILAGEAGRKQATWKT